MATSYRTPPAQDGATERARAKPLAVHARPRPVRHVRAPVPIHFAESEEVPEGKEHLEVRTFLYGLLRFALGPEHTVGSDQFVYWDAHDAHRKLSPDVFVRLGTPNTNFGSWKTWEHGAPELAVEIISPNEGDGVPWDEKIERYHASGVTELVRFDPREAEGARLRAWDRVEGDLVEREVAGDTTPCQTLGLTWVVRAIDDAPVALRLVDAAGELVLDGRETAKAKQGEAEAKMRAETERAETEARGRREAEARIRALEEELRRRG